MAYVIKNKFPIDLNKRKAVGFSLPMNGSAVFKPTYTTKDQLKSNLILYFITNNGERFFNYNMGANLREKLYEGLVNNTEEVLLKMIKDDIKVWFPQVNIDDITLNRNEEESSVTLGINYSVVNFGITDNLELIVQ